MPNNNNTAPEFGVIAIGNALVDVLYETDDAYIEAQNKEFGMAKGSMSLVDAERALALYGDMSEPVEVAGGSAGNTMACFASLGGTGAYIGKVADGQLGNKFAKSLKDMGVTYETTRLKHGPSTGRCMIFVTPDGERTMNTYLGAAVELTPDDIDADFIAKGQVLYLEGYLFDPPQAMEAFVKAARLAHESGRRVALTLSDSFCVDRHREAFKNLVSMHVDILFANEDEIKSLYETDDLEEAINQVKTQCALVAVTRGEKGSIIIQNGQQIEIKAEPNVTMVDSTGAGDAYAAGFLFGFTEGMGPEACGHIGSIAAAEVISKMGPRPVVDLSELVKQKQAA